MAAITRRDSGTDHLVPRCSVATMGLRTLVAFIGGLIVAFLVGQVPPEFIGWLREWAGRGGPDPDEP